MRVGSRDSVWSEYGATRADRRAFDVEAPERSETRADGRAREVVAQSPAQDQPVLEPLGQREVEPFWLRPSDRQEEAPFAAADASTETRAEESNPDPAEGAAKDEPVRKGLGRPLTKEQEAEVEALRQRDAEVRAHEAAHMAAAGAMGGGASFDYQVGPDGRHYAVGGEVPVRTGHASSPEEAIRNAAQLRAAALAPAQPSAQDRAVAAEAAAMEAAAR
ncbi:MAG TPA: putative metalloprotease CJM1_0395 family protein, partial [Polyangia bacterium]